MNGKVLSINASLQYTSRSKPIYKGIQFNLAQGQVTCMLGQSGCGKSSFLKQLVGLQQTAWLNALCIHDSTFAGSDIHHQASTTSSNQAISLEAFRQQIAYMGQQDSLLPWLSVIDNVLLESDLKRPIFKKKARFNSESVVKVKAILQQVGLQVGLDDKVDTLSGGMRQRVALARTLIQDKPIILMDEPFSSVDAITRHQLQQLTCELFRDKTVLLVTHDPLEALIMGHHLVLFRRGAPKLQADLEGSILPLEVPAQFPPRHLDQGLGAYHEHILVMMQGVR